jgi:GDPmannose 4,6-dehydratase
MWRMLQAPHPDVYVLASGHNATVREFVTMACKAAKIDIAWQGQGRDEKGTDRASGKTIVRVNPRYFRPAEVEALIGNASKAKRELGWEAKTSLEELCNVMVGADLQRIAEGLSF